MRASFTPDCETPAGCIIEDVAADPVLNRLATDWLRAEALKDVAGESYALDELYNALQVREDKDLHLELEMLYAKYKAKCRAAQHDQ